jgi:hypothetical protein
MSLFGRESETERLTVRVTDKLFVGQSQDRLPFVFYMDVLEPNPHHAVRHTMVVQAAGDHLLDWFELQIGTTWEIDVEEFRGKKRLVSVLFRHVDEETK